MIPRFPKSPDWGCAAMEAYAESGLLAIDEPFERAASVCRGRLVYLATPYSKPVLDENGAWCLYRSSRLGQEAELWMTRFASIDVTAISPIAAAARMLELPMGIDPLDQQFWTRWCAPILRASGVVVVPAIDGWRESDGVWHEATEALSANRPVLLLRAGSEFGGRDG